MKRLNSIADFQLFGIYYYYTSNFPHLNAKRLGEGGTQTFDDIKYITYGLFLQG